MSREIARELFASLIKLGDNSWNGYSILIDNNFVKRVYATSDQEAIKEFRNWVSERNKITTIKNEPAKGISKLTKISSYGMIDTDSVYVDMKITDDDISLAKEELNKKYAKQKEIYLELTGQKEMSEETKEILDKAKARFK